MSAARFAASSLLTVVFALFPALAAAQQPLRVGVALFPPNVIRADDGELQGFDVELWEEIARQEDLPYEFQTYALADLLAAVENSDVDVALAGLSVSAAREADMDFSYPYMTAGLRILSRNDDRPQALLYLRTALDSGAARALAFLLGFIALCAHVFFLAERGSKSISRNYFPGILEAAWFIVATMTTVGYGDLAPHRWLGRFVAFVVMVTGIGLFGVLVADLTTGIALQRIQARIAGPHDLNGRRVVTVRGSTSVAAARSYGASVLEVDDIEAAVAALDANEADAVVFDGPPLLHYLQENPDQSAVLTPQRLTTNSYAIAFPTASPLRETVDRALLRLEESGEKNRLYEKWFGVSP